MVSFGKLGGKRFMAVLGPSLMTKACPARGATEGGLKHNHVLHKMRTSTNIRTWGFV